MGEFHLSDRNLKASLKVKNRDSDLDDAGNTFTQRRSRSKCFTVTGSRDPRPPYEAGIIIITPLSG